MKAHKKTITIHPLKNPFENTRYQNKSDSSTHGGTLRSQHSVTCGIHWNGPENQICQCHNNSCNNRQFSRSEQDLLVLFVTSPGSFHCVFRLCIHFRNSVVTPIFIIIGYCDECFEVDSTLIHRARKIRLCTEI